MSTVINGSTGINKVQDGAVSSGPPMFYTRAFGCYNGTSGTTLRAGNCTISKSGTGVYVVTFTIPMPDANYAITFGVNGDNVVVPSGSEYVQSIDYVNKTTSGFTIRTYEYVGSLNDTVAVDINDVSFSIIW